jgi:hypothetical protein
MKVDSKAVTATLSPNVIHALDQGLRKRTATQLIVGCRFVGMSSD